jgi:hypothetical protein
MSHNFNRRPFQQRLVSAALALLASSTTIALVVLAPLATNGGLA